VAGYPEGHIDHFKDLPECPPEAYKLDLQYLKDKVLPATRNPKPESPTPTP
jgi:hypothetical protein